MTAIDVSRLDANLLDAVVRLLRLLDSATDVRILAPLVTREIVYRLMMGGSGRTSIGRYGSRTWRGRSG